MASFISYLIDLHRQSLTGKIELIDQWYFFKSPLIPTTIVLSYLLFVLYLGPRMMANRKPFELKKIIIVYNLIQIVICYYILTSIFRVENCLKILLSLGCAIKPDVLTKEMEVFFEVGWWYILTKHIDLLDTIFFVLRKKTDHVSFLHVYHHASMALSTWLIHKYMPTEETGLITIINTFVHIVMYTYYFIAALGPQYRKFIWWKPYLTKLQLFQFFIFIVYILCTVLFGCQKQYHVPTAVIGFMAFQSAIFFVLFIDFYRKTYLKKEKRPKENNNMIDMKENEKLKNHVVNSILLLEENGNKIKRL